MSKLKRTFKKIFTGIEGNYDDVMFTLRKRLNADHALQIVTYRSYGTANRLYVKGRVLRDKGIRKATQADSVWSNLLNMYRRFESDEVPGARLKVTFHSEAYYTTTDPEGYFVLNLLTEVPIQPNDMWYELELELTEAPLAFRYRPKATAHVLVPPSDAEYGIISDIDDTIVKTTATNLLAMSRNTFLHNAHSRLPFAGVAEFYKSLQLGRNGKRNNPFFYVSSSPWNLYDLLVDFLDINDIPEGPLLLRDFGMDVDKASADHMGHKFSEIKNIMLTYPHLPFILIGDSGQEDPKIYREIVAEFPGRILAIYIRDVQLADREKIAIEISKSLVREKVEMVIVDNTVEAAQHAADRGLIYRDEIPKIIIDKKLDKGELEGKAEMG